MPSNSLKLDRCSLVRGARDRRWVGRIAVQSGIAVLTAGACLQGAHAAESETPTQPATALPKIQVLSQEETTVGYVADRSRSATRTDTALRDVPQAVTVITRDLIQDQSMQSMADLVRYVPGVGMAQGEGNRDTPILRGNASTADFFVDGVRDDVEYFRDLYNVDRVEALKGPNAMIFGRGGAGGVINRVTRQAQWAPVREISLQAGSWENRRVTADFGDALSDRFAFRITGLYEDSDSYRDDVELERYGVNPTLGVRLGNNTVLRLGYEYFSYDRTADRGIPSYQGRPVQADASTFFGDPELSPTEATVNMLSAVLDHEFGNGASLRNRTVFADYDKFYQNVFPGAVSANGATVSISAYNNEQLRENLFNQTDLVFSLDTGAVSHRMLVGMELGRQVTDNFRNTGFFNNSATSVSVPLDNPRSALPVTFRQSATDADNHGRATNAALYVQDQIELSSHFRAVLGVRYDQFKMDFRNNRTGVTLESTDDLISPRVGLIYKPAEPISIYASYSISYLPRAGAQLTSLSPTNQALDPEEFRNQEIGAKWDVRDNLTLSAAIYRLDRTNVVIPDPLDPTLSVLVNGQRSEGIELEASGRITDAWSIFGGYAYQDGELTRTQSATAPAGARLAQIPEHKVSLWSKYQLAPAWAFGLGVIHQSEIFAATDNLVTLPDFTRVDAAVFYSLNERVRAQLNVENLFDEDYYANAHSNNNISPGSPLAVRVGVTASF